MKAIDDTYDEMQKPNLRELQFSVNGRKNILYISPMMSGRHLYKYIMPYIVLHETQQAATAMTNLVKYDPLKQYADLDTPVSPRDIIWSDRVVIPFTTQNLVDFYDSIRTHNEHTKIIFNVDFNYYLLDEDHPYHPVFTEENIRNIEDNIFFADVVVFNNSRLMQYVEERMQKIHRERFNEMQSQVAFVFQPFFTHPKMFCENITDEHVPVEKHQMRIGIIGSQFSWGDISAYREQMKKISDRHPVKFVLFGFDGNNAAGQSCLAEGMDVEIVPRCSIVHYFKQLYLLNLDAVFIPKKFNAFNETSENYNVFLEAGIMRIAVIAPAMFPYTELDKDAGMVMFLYEPDNVEAVIDQAVTDGELLRKKGKIAQQRIYDCYSVHEANLKIMMNIFS